MSPIFLSASGWDSGCRRTLGLDVGLVFCILYGARLIANAAMRVKPMPEQRGRNPCELKTRAVNSIRGIQIRDYSGIAGKTCEPNLRIEDNLLIGRTPRGSYSRKGVFLPSRCLLESPFLEPLLRTLLRTLLAIKT